MELYYAYLRLLVAFPLVIALIYFGLRFLMPYFAPAMGMGRRMKVVERLALSNRTFLYVVKVDGAYLLLAATPNAVTLLKELDEGWEESLQGGPETAKIQQMPLSFAGILRELRERSRQAFQVPPGRQVIRKVWTLSDKKRREKRN
ncbi:MAG TPA: flagellar biosynthetic protein FliO [Firmicutes bacterium]|jgi:flagellar biosynthetic protein FliO|nr:flagellar biosynthetic protein FliO [Bacillota bacterium]